MTNDERMTKSDIRHSTFVIRHSLFLLFAALPLCFGQRQPERPPPLDAAKAVSEARALVADLLAQRPAQNLTHTGVLKIRAKGGKERLIPFRFVIITNATNSISEHDT